MFKISNVYLTYSINLQRWLWFDCGWSSWKLFASPLSWSSDTKDCKPPGLTILITCDVLKQDSWCCTIFSYLKVKCLNSLGASDLMHKYIMRTQHMPLYGKDIWISTCCDLFQLHSSLTLSFFFYYGVYLPAIAITIHRLVAQVQRPNIEWPKSYHRYPANLLDLEVSRESYFSIFFTDLNPIHIQIPHSVDGKGGNFEVLVQHNSTIYFKTFVN